MGDLGGYRYDFATAQEYLVQSIGGRPVYPALAQQYTQELVDDLDADHRPAPEDLKAALALVGVFVQRVNGNIGISEEPCGHSTRPDGIVPTKRTRASQIPPNPPPRRPRRTQPSGVSTSGNPQSRALHAPQLREGYFYFVRFVFAFL